MIRATEEEWSIISSSSEMEEDWSSTSSSRGSGEYGEVLRQEIGGSSDEHQSVSDHTDPFYDHDHADPEESVRTLRLPSLGAGSGYGGSGGVIVGDNSGEDQLNDDGNTVTGDNEGVNSREVPLRSIARIIDFYENLSANTLRLHQSIKHQSGLMYQQLTGTVPTGSVNDNIIKEEEQEQVHDVFQGDETQSDEKDAVMAKIDQQMLLCNNDTTNSKYSVRFSDVKSKLNQVIGANSEYLIYFVMATVLASYSSVKLFQYITAVSEPEPTNALFKFWGPLDSVFFEQVQTKPWFFGPTKNYKQFKYSNEINALYQKLYSGGEYLFLLKNSLKQYYQIGLKEAENIWCITVHNIDTVLKHKSTVHYTDISRNLMYKSVAQCKDVSLQIVEYSNKLTLTFDSRIKPGLKSIHHDTMKLAQVLYDRSYWYGMQGWGILMKNAPQVYQSFANYTIESWEKARNFLMKGIIKPLELNYWMSDTFTKPSRQAFQDLKDLELVKQVCASYTRTKQQMYEQFQ